MGLSSKYYLVLLVCVFQYRTCQYLYCVSGHASELQVDIFFCEAGSCENQSGLQLYVDEADHELLTSLLLPPKHQEYRH